MPALGLRPRLRRALAVLVTLVTVAAAAACGGGDTDEAADAGVQMTRDLSYAPGRTLDVVAPPRQAAPEGASGPVVVTLHGCCGDRHDLTPLAVALATGGAVVFNASWQNMNDGGGWPHSYEQAACALRWARQEAPRYGGDPGRVTVVGWSDGALVAGVAALLGGTPAPAQTSCLAAGRPAPDGEPALADALVVVAGFPGWPAGDPVPPEQVNGRTVAFFGGRPDEAPDAWAGGNPFTHLHRNPAIPVRLVVGREDPLLGANGCFLAAARAAGHPVRLVVAPGAGPQTVIAPRTPEGRITVAEVLATARGEPMPAAAPAPPEEPACPPVSPDPVSPDPVSPGGGS